MIAKGHDVAHVHIRHIWPMPKNMSVLLKGFGNIIVPEMNMGQLKTLLRDQFLVDAKPLNKVSGQPFRIVEIEEAIAEALAKNHGNGASLHDSRDFDGGESAQVTVEPGTTSLP